MKITIRPTTRRIVAIVRRRRAIARHLNAMARPRNGILPRGTIGRINLVTKRLVIAIDGPSGAGKGTISRTLSETLGYRHIDTGAMYRAVGWKALYENLPLDDEAAVAALAQRAAIVVEGGVVSIDGH